MAGKGRKGRHPKKGPGGPARTSRLSPGTVRMVGPIGSGGPGGPRPTLEPPAPQTEGLVGIVLEQLEGALANGTAQPGVIAEVEAQGFVDALKPKAGPNLGAMLGDFAEALAQRRSPAADLYLAGLARAASGAGLRQPRTVWQRRRLHRDVDRLATMLDEDAPTEVLEVDHVCGDGVTLLLAMDNPSGAYTVAVYIDHNLGGIAKDVFFGPPLADVQPLYADPADDFLLRSVGFDEARARFDDAVDRTARAFDPPVSDDYDDLLPIVARRFRLLDSGSWTVVPPATVTDAERIAHIAAFHVSPEYDTIPSHHRGVAHDVARLWIDHAVDHTIGGPRRVSAVLVELFCTDWFPRTVVADGALVAGTPAVIEAWLRFAGRTTGVADRWVAEAIESLGHFEGGLWDAIDDPTAWGIGKTALGGASLLGAASAAGPTLRFSQTAPRTQAWRALEEHADGTTVHVEVDHSSLRESTYAITKQIATEVSLDAVHLLGPSFAQRAMELAVALGSLDPCPFDGTYAEGWPGAIVWLLADDNDAFEPRTVGRRRNDLADALPMTRPTYESKVKQIRQRLGLVKGELRIEV